MREDRGARLKAALFLGVRGWVGVGWFNHLIPNRWSSGYLDCQVNGHLGGHVRGQAGSQAGGQVVPLWIVR